MPGSRIFKYPLKVTDVQTVSMPAGAKLLSVMLQYKALYVWARVDPSGPLVERTFYVVGTGNPLPDEDAVWDPAYLGSVIDDPFVWHVFVGSMER
jgi:hypothetical protein